MAASVVEAEEMNRIADDHGLVLMAGHTFLYTAAVNKMKDLISSGGARAHLLHQHHAREPGAVPGGHQRRVGPPRRTTCRS